MTDLRGGAGKVRSGFSLVEVVLAIGILVAGILPIFLLLTESKRVTSSSVNELKATGMASSMIDGLKRIPASDLVPLFDRDLSDESLPGTYTLARLGVPPAPANLQREVYLRLVNQPVLPLETFTNPWGRIVEMTVKVFLRKRESDPQSRKKLIMELKGYRIVGQ